MRPLERHAKRTLKELMAPEKEAAIRLKAAELVLAYRFGRPRQRSEFSGPDGQAITTLSFQADITRLTAAFETPAEAEEMTGDLLEAAQRVSFAKALAEQATANGKVIDADPLPLPSSRDEAPARDSVLEASSTDGGEKKASESPPERLEEAIPDPESEPPAEPETPEVGSRLRFLGSDFYIEAHHGDREGLPPIFELRGPGGLVRRAAFDVVMDQLRKQQGGDLGEWQVEGARAPTDVLFEPSRPDQERSAGWGNRRRTR